MEQFNFNIEFIATIFENFIIVEFITRFLGYKTDNIKKYFGFAITLVLLIFLTIAINSITIFEGIGIIIPVIICVLYSMIYLKGLIFEKILVSCLTIIIILLINVITLSIFSFILDVEMISLITERNSYRVFILFITKILFFFVTRIILYFKSDREFVLEKNEWTAILLIFIMSLIISVFIFEILINPINIQEQTLYIMTIIGIIIINMISYHLFVKISNDNKEKSKYLLMKLQFEQQQKYINQVKKSYKEIKKIKHDIKNHIICGISLMNEHKYDKAKTYFEELCTGKIIDISNFVVTESDVMNAIINSKISICKDKNINIKYQITGSVHKIPEVDLSILLANILDNAIEACSNINTDPKIILEIYDYKNYLCITAKNTILTSVLKYNPKLITSKVDKDNHGFGILSIKDIVEKYNGMIDFYEKDNMFIVKVLLHF